MIFPLGSEMRCEICGGATSYYFSKTFNAFNLGEVDYWRCDTCGFVFSRTHLEMSQEAWTELNLLCHETYQGGDENVLAWFAGYSDRATFDAAQQARDEISRVATHSPRLTGAPR